MLRIARWPSFQSYKDRKPPWIRLHKSLLDNFEFQTMSMESKAILPMLWLLASEDEDPVSGCIRDSYEKIAFRLRVDKKTLVKVIGECRGLGFIEPEDDENINDNPEVTKPLRDRYESVTKFRKSVTPETETETETDACARDPDPPPGLDVVAWERWVTYRREIRKPVKPASVQAAQRKLAAYGADQAAVVEQSIANSWAGLFDLKSRPPETRDRFAGALG